MLKHFCSLLLIFLVIESVQAQPDGNTIYPSGVADSLQTPSEVTLLEPRINSQVPGTEVQFVWSASEPDITSYHLMIATDGRFTNMVFEDSTLSDTAFVVQLPAIEETYIWRVRAGNSVGWSSFTAPFFFKAITTDLEELVSVPRSVVLSGIFPNPFGGSLAVSISTGKALLVRFALFDVLGTEVSWLGERSLQPGTTEIHLKSQISLPTGKYFLRAEFDGATITRALYHIR